MEILIHRSTQQRLSPLIFGAVLFTCLLISSLSLLTDKKAQDQSILLAYKSFVGKPFDWHLEIEESFLEKDSWLTARPFFSPEQKIFRQVSIEILSSAWSLNFEPASVGFLPATFINLHFLVLRLIFFGLIFLKLAAVAGIFGFIAAKARIKAYSNVDLLGLTGSGRLFDSELQINNLLQKKKELREVPSLLQPKIKSALAIKRSKLSQILLRYDGVNNTNLDLIGIILAHADSSGIETAALSLELIFSAKKLSAQEKSDLAPTGNYDQKIISDLSHCAAQIELSAFKNSFLASFILSHFTALFYLQANALSAGKPADIILHAKTILHSLPTLTIDYSAKELSALRLILRESVQNSKLASEQLGKGEYELSRLSFLLAKILLHQPIDHEQETLQTRLGILNQQWSQELMARLCGLDQSSQPEIYYDDISVSLPLLWIVETFDRLIKPEKDFFSQYFCAPEKSENAGLQILARQTSHEHKLPFEVMLRWFSIKAFLEDFGWIDTPGKSGPAVFPAEIIFSKNAGTAAKQEAQVPIMLSRINHFLRNKNFVLQAKRVIKIIYADSSQSDRLNGSSETACMGLFR